MRVGDVIVPLTVERVSWFEADGDYVIAHAGTSRHMLHLTQSRLEQRLDARRPATRDTPMGKYQGYIEDLKRRKGPDADQPHRVQYRKLVRA